MAKLSAYAWLAIIAGLTIGGYTTWSLYTKSENGEDTNENVEFVVFGIIIGLMLTFGALSAKAFK